MLTIGLLVGFVTGALVAWMLTDHRADDTLTRITHEPFGAEWAPARKAMADAVAARAEA